MNRESGISTCEIVQLVDPLKSLAEKLSPRIAAHEYETLLIEGVSARIPGMIFSRVIDKIHEKCGYSPITTIDSGRLKAAADFDRLRQSLFTDSSIPSLQPVGKPLLIFTEYMKYGDKIRQLRKIMEDGGLRFDVATVFATFGEERYRQNLPLDSKYDYGYQYPEDLIDWLGYFGDGESRLPVPSIWHQDWLNVEIWNILNNGGKRTEKAVQTENDIEKVASLIESCFQPPS